MQASSSVLGRLLSMSAICQAQVRLSHVILRANQICLFNPSKPKSQGNLILSFDWSIIIIFTSVCFTYATLSLTFSLVIDSFTPGRRTGSSFFQILYQQSQQNMVIMVIIVHNHGFFYHLGATQERKKQLFSNFSFPVRDTKN